MENSAKAPYVREAFPNELENVAHVLSSAFANDPLIHWLGSSMEEIDLKSTFNKSQEKFMRIQLYFIDSLLKSVRLIGGRVTVAVAPNESTGSEEIVSVGLWIPHWKLRELDSLSVMIRSQQHRAIIGTWKHWGGWGYSILRVCTLYYLLCLPLWRQLLCRR